MTQEQLKQGQIISRKIEEIESCIEALDRSKNEDPGHIINKFLNDWRNVGSSGIKQECAQVAFDAIIMHLRAEKAKLENDFSII